MCSRAALDGFRFSGAKPEGSSRRPDRRGHATGAGLVPVSSPESANTVTNVTAFGARIARLPVELDVAIPVRDFRVRDLLALEPGRLVESEWSSGEDLPLAAGEVQLAWSEFEVIETRAWRCA